jgi:hypothetical protein
MNYECEVTDAQNQAHTRRIFIDRPRTPASTSQNPWRRILAILLPSRFLADFRESAPCCSRKINKTSTNTLVQYLAIVLQLQHGKGKRGNARRTG